MDDHFIFCSSFNPSPPVDKLTPIKGHPDNIDGLSTSKKVIELTPKSGAIILHPLYSQREHIPLGPPMNERRACMSVASVFASYAAPCFLQNNIFKFSLPKIEDSREVAKKKIFSKTLNFFRKEQAVEPLLKQLEEEQPEDHLMLSATMAQYEQETPSSNLFQSFYQWLSSRVSWNKPLCDSKTLTTKKGAAFYGSLNVWIAHQAQNAPAYKGYGVGDITPSEKLKCLLHHYARYRNRQLESYSPKEKRLFTQLTYLIHDPSLPYDWVLMPLPEHLLNTINADLFSHEVGELVSSSDMLPPDTFEFFAQWYLNLRNSKDFKHSPNWVHKRILGVFYHLVQFSKQNAPYYNYITKKIIQKIHRGATKCSDNAVYQLFKAELYVCLGLVNNNLKLLMAIGVKRYILNIIELELVDYSRPGELIEDALFHLLQLDIFKLGYCGKEMLYDQCAHKHTLHHSIDYVFQKFINPEDLVHFLGRWKPWLRHLNLYLEKQDRVSIMDYVSELPEFSQLSEEDQASGLIGCNAVGTIRDERYKVASALAKEVLIKLGYITYDPFYELPEKLL